MKRKWAENQCQLSSKVEFVLVNDAETITNQRLIKEKDSGTKLLTHTVPLDGRIGSFWIIIKPQ